MAFTTEQRKTWAVYISITMALGAAIGMMAFFVVQPSSAARSVDNSIISYDLRCIQENWGAQGGNLDVLANCEVTKHGYSISRAMAKAFVGQLTSKPKPWLRSSSLKSSSAYQSLNRVAGSPVMSEFSEGKLADPIAKKIGADTEKAIPAISRRPFLQQASALLLLPNAANAYAKQPDLKEEVLQIEANISKEERNKAGDKAGHSPQISFEGASAQGKKLVFTVPHKNLSPPDFSYIELMWIKDEKTGKIITAKKFRPAEEELLITAYVRPGQKLTAASKDNKFGIWEGTFTIE